MKKFSIILLILSISISSAVFGQSQKNAFTSTADEDDEAVIKVTTTNINLPVTVFNDRGKFVPNLKRDNFQVLENARPQPIIQFHAQADLPLSIALMMDASTSVRNRLDFQKIAIKSFFGSVLRSEKDQVAFYTFNETVQLREDFTSDLSRILRAVDGIKAVGGSTGLYDAVYKICREKMGRNSSRRRVIVIVTDGADTNSANSLEKAIAIAQRTETSIYGISTKGGSVFRVEGSPYLNTDDRDFRRLCRDTGGDVFFPSNPEELTVAFQLVTDFLRNQYLLVYEPNTNTDGRFHEIEVRIVGRKGLSALTRRGYFAK
jgi:Ca-activated chloride channel homolog